MVCVRVVGRAFLLYVLEIPLIQLIHANAQGDRRVDGQREEYIALLELTQPGLLTFHIQTLVLLSV